MIVTISKRYLRCIRATHNPDNIYVLNCPEVELSPIAKGLYAVEDTGRRRLSVKVPNEIDAAASHDVLYSLGDMSAQIDAALG